MSHAPSPVVIVIADRDENGSTPGGGFAKYNFTRGSAGRMQHSRRRLHGKRLSSDVAYILTLFSNIGLSRAKRRESLCYPQDMAGLHPSRVTTRRPPSQQ
jgi:hypothetical protein